MPQPWGRVKLTEVNPHLACVLCHGYFVDATTMAECPHSFCRSCIILYLETKSYCPICEVQIHKTKPHLNLKPDKTLQDIVYKLVPGLFHDEMKRRREFYAKNPNRDLYLSPEARGVGVERIIYSPEDKISLSLEYYDDDREREEWASTRPGTSAQALTQQKPSSEEDALKRYLLCPANVNMGLLKKFIRLKYGLSEACTVEVLYRRESLPDSYSLMDIAYIYTWKRNEPIRFYYRIHVPTRLKASLPPLTPSTEPILEPETKKLKSPELLDAVGLRPKPPELRSMPKLDLDTEVDKSSSATETKSSSVKETKEKDRPTITTAEDTAVSLLLALSNGVGPKRSPEVPKAEETADKPVPTPEATKAPPEAPKPVTGNGGVFKVPQSLTKRFVFTGGKLVAVKPKQSSGGKSEKQSEKTKLNGKLNGESTVSNDLFTNPLGLASNGQLGRLPPGSPRPPPNADKVFKTKYMSPSGLALNWPNPEVTVSQNAPKEIDPPSKTPVQPSLSSQSKSNSKTQSRVPGVGKSPVSIANGQPVKHRKEINRLEQIVQNCLKKEASQKGLAEESKSGKTLKEENSSGPQSKRVEDTNTRPALDSAPDATRGNLVGAKPTAEPETPKRNFPSVETGTSILKRKLNDHIVNRRPELQNNGDFKKRKLVTPDVSIELMANPSKDKLQKERKREPSDLSSITKQFLHDIQRMKKLETEMKMSKVDQMCASTVQIEKVPAPPSKTIYTPKTSPCDNTKAIDGNDFSSEEDQLFIDIRNKCEALKRKASEPSIAIERVTEEQTAKSTQPSSDKSDESPVTPTRVETPPKSSGTHKKLPRLIEINAPPRPKLPPVSVPGVKLTTVRKEVPLIGKEGRRDGSGALDLSSGMSPPGTPKNGNKSSYQRPTATDKSPAPLSPLTAMTPFSSPDANRSPIRIPTLKPKTSPNPRPSSLSSSSPSPPAETFPTSAFQQQLYRNHVELQSRLFASQVNNNLRRDPQSAKKFEEWMRNVMNLPHHPLMSQLSPEAGRK